MPSDPGRLKDELLQAILAEFERAGVEAPRSIVESVDGAIERLARRWAESEDADALLSDFRAAARAATSSLAEVLERERTQPAGGAEDVLGEGAGPHESGKAAAAELLHDLLEGAGAPGGAPREGAPPGSVAGMPSRLGDFEILRWLGGGGMGEVYLARQASLGREVALKVLSPRVAEDPELLERFLREAKAAARIDHPGVVAVLEAGIEEGRPYIAMQHVRGVSLEHLLQKRPYLEVERALAIARDAARAIEAAHRAGVVHRDVKPGNILIEGDETSARTEGRVFLADFGLAAVVDASTITGTGQILGTPAYMAPEQARGAAATTASDVYSLGATLYAMLAGRAPHEGSSYAEVLARVREEEPVPLRRLRPSLDHDTVTICEKAMRWDPWRRYASAADLADDIDRRLRREPIRARPPTWAYRGRLWLRRNPRSVLVASVAMLLVVVAGFVVERELSWRSGLADAERLLGEGEPARALEALPKDPLHFASRRKASLEFRVNVALGSFREAAEAARDLSSEDRRAALERLQTMIDDHLEAAEAIALDGGWSIALELSTRTFAAIEILAEEPELADWAEDVLRRALRVVAWALLRVRHESALKLWQDERLGQRLSLARRELAQALRLPEEEAQALGGSAGRISEHLSLGATEYMRHELFLNLYGGAMASVEGLGPHAGSRPFHHVAKLLDITGSAAEEPWRTYALGYLRFLACLRGFLTRTEGAWVHRWVDLLDSLRPQGETQIVVHLEPQATGDIDGDGIWELALGSGREVQLWECRKEGLARKGTLTLAEGDGHAWAFILKDLDGDGRDELIVNIHILPRDERDPNRGYFRAYAWTGQELRQVGKDGPVVGALAGGGSRGLAIADIDRDGEEDLIVGLGSAGDDNRQVLVVWRAFEEGQRHEILDMGGKPADVLSVFAADFDGDRTTDVGCATGPWKGFDLRFWRFAGDKLVGPLRYGPLGSFHRAVALEVDGEGPAEVFAVKSSFLSTNSEHFPPSHPSGIENGAYLFRIPRGQTIERQEIHGSLEDPGEIFLWRDLLGEEVQDPPERVHVQSLSAGRWRDGEAAVAVSWDVAKGDLLFQFVDLYLQEVGPHGKPAASFTRHRLFRREGPGSLVAEIVQLPGSGGRGFTPGIVLIEKVGTASGGDCQMRLFSFAAPERRSFESVLYPDLLEADRRTGQYPEAVSLAREAPLEALGMEGARKITLGWAMAAAVGLDDGALEEALWKWDALEREPQAPAAALDELAALRRGLIEGPALRGLKPVRVLEGEVRLDRLEREAWRSPEVCIGPE
ncbi:MAG: protein kinase, partial [Planctomycetes bacterium]|nr:protein kinase [Planctomycetota bacterium]